MEQAMVKTLTFLRRKDILFQMQGKQLRKSKIEYFIYLESSSFS